MRIPFWQAKSWGKGNFDPYSKSHCCFCGKPIDHQTAKQIMMSRSTQGEADWWACSPDEPPLPDEIAFADGNPDWARFPLPIGPDCLKKHPEFAFAVVAESPAGEAGK